MVSTASLGSLFWLTAACAVTPKFAFRMLETCDIIGNRHCPNDLPWRCLEYQYILIGIARTPRHSGIRRLSVSKNQFSRRSDYQEDRRKDQKSISGDCIEHPGIESDATRQEVGTGPRHQSSCG